MTPAPSSDYLAKFSEALVSEIKSEMGRRDLSARGLASLIGVNPQYVTSRIAGGNPRTGKRVDITVTDLRAIAGALDLDATDLLARASAATAAVDELARRRSSRTSEPAPIVDPSELEHEPSAAQPEPTKDVEGDEDGGTP